MINGFFMELMFFISGLFVWKSLTKKGFVCFIKGRCRRLGIPFLAMLGVIMPLAYYPSFLMGGGEHNFLTYWCGWSWVSGPAWFLSTLLGFDLLAAIYFRFGSESHLRITNYFDKQPWSFFVAIIILSGASFIPLWAVYGPWKWLEWRAITYGQACRVGIHAVYFFAGFAVGAGGLESTFLIHPGPLTKRWWAWLIISAIAAIGYVVAFGWLGIDPDAAWTRPAGWYQVGLYMVLYCAILSFGVLALFLRFVQLRHSWADNLSENSYTIYIMHYPIVIWTQYLLLGTKIAAETKAIIVFSLSLGLSWMISVLLRRIPGVTATF
jgi:surface polysaccharide O-acyltransferase-like enzyme